MSYYIGNMPFGDPNDIQHYGRKGMKWGKQIFGKIADSAVGQFVGNTINYGRNAQRVQDARNLRVAAANNNLNRAIKGFIRKGAMLNELDARQRMDNSAQGAARRAGEAASSAGSRFAKRAGEFIGNARTAAGNAKEAAGNFMKKNVGRNIRRGQLYVGAMAGQAAKKAGEALGNAKEAAGNFAKGAREFVGNTVNYKKNKSRKETLERNIKGRDRNVPTNRSMYINQLSQWRDAKGKTENSLQGRVGSAVSSAGKAVGRAAGRAKDAVGDAISKGREKITSLFKKKKKK